MKITTIQEAMQAVADHPEMRTDNLLTVKVHELVCRSLFEIANQPDANKRGSMARANVARQMIFTRMVGRRRAGSHPAMRTNVELQFQDLTGTQVTK